MKKLFSVLFVALTLICISGCSLFGGNDNNKKEEKNEFSVQYDDETMNYSFNKDATISIEPRYKEGFVLDGFYTQQQGKGTKLIDWDGTCLNASFAQDGSTVLYPNYLDIDYEYVFKSSVWNEEDPLTASYNVYGKPQFVYSSIFSLLGKSYIYQVAKSNPQIGFKITAYADIYDDSGEFSIGVGKECDNGGILNKITFARPSQYTKMSVSADVKGRVFTIKDNKIFLGFYCNKFGHMFYFKNMQIEIGIVNENAET